MARTLLEPGPGALAEFDEWLESAAHGDVNVYWVGDLQFDRQKVIKPSDPNYEEASKTISALNGVAKRVLFEQQQKSVVLTQKRIAENVFEYRATRRRNQFKPANNQKEAKHGSKVLA